MPRRVFAPKPPQAAPIDWDSMLREADAARAEEAKVSREAAERAKEFLRVPDPFQELGVRVARLEERLAALEARES